jgi:hypothetical protein
VKPIWHRFIYSQQRCFDPRPLRLRRSHSHHPVPRGRTKEGRISIRDFIPIWSVVRQLRGRERLSLGGAAQSSRQANLVSRTVESDKVAKSICPYCGVGCGQHVFDYDKALRFRRWRCPSSRRPGTHPSPWRRGSLARRAPSPRRSPSGGCGGRPGCGRLCAPR